MNICPYCSKEYSNKGIGTHIWRKHTPEGQAFKSIPPSTKPWNTGLTKETDERVRRISLKVSISRKGKPGHPISEETKKVLSEKMKLAHAEGRAWNIGMSRWNNEPSWPEVFFMRVIENEFEDKNYVREFPMGKFSIDFAWPLRKVAIEIDGEQHFRFKEQQRRDREKETLLEEAGWRLLRIKWTDISQETKSWIEKAKNFVHQEGEPDKRTGHVLKTCGSERNAGQD